MAGSSLATNLVQLSGPTEQPIYSDWMGGLSWANPALKRPHPNIAPIAATIGDRRRFGPA